MYLYFNSRIGTGHLIMVLKSRRLGASVVFLFSPAHLSDASGRAQLVLGYRWIGAKCLNRNSFVVGSGITEMPTQRKQQPWTKTDEQGYPPKKCV